MGHSTVVERGIARFKFEFGLPLELKTDCSVKNVESVFTVGGEPLGSLVICLDPAIPQLCDSRSSP